MGQEMQEKLESVLAGDRAAAGWLYDTFAAQIFRRLRQRYSYLGDPELEDILHEVYVQLFDNQFRLLRRFLKRHEGKDWSEAVLGRYIWDLACGLATNRGRSAAVRKVVALDSWHDTNLAPDAERLTIGRDLLLRLDSCLEESGERVYLYSKLRYQGGFSPEEIAKMTGWSRKATYKLKQGLNEALRRCVEKLGGVPGVSVVGMLAGLGMLLLACSRGEAPGGVSATLRGHDEVVVGSQGHPVPLFLGRQPPQHRQLGRALCIDVPPTVDTSRWQASLSFPGTGQLPQAEPAERVGTTLCFDLELPELPADQDVEFCAQITDLYDGSTFPLPCQLLRYKPDQEERQSLAKSFQTVLFSGEDESRLDRWLERVEKQAYQSATQGFPTLAVENLVIAAHVLRRQGTPQRLEEASRLLEQLPAWLERPEAREWKAMVAYERAKVALDSGWQELKVAWSSFQEADRLYRLLAHPLRIYVALNQASILSRIGALREARQRFEAVAEDCNRVACSSRVVLDTYSQLAWLTVQDPDAAPSEIAQARSLLEQALAASADRMRGTESANHLVNRAYLEVRQGGDPTRLLEEARQLLRRDSSDHDRIPMLLAWTDLIEGIFAGSRGELDRALALCEGASKRSTFPRLSAWASSCLGRVHRLKGDLVKAQWAFEQALFIHEYATAEGLGQEIDLGPGQRAEDYYQAARVAVERGDAAAAWELLTRLDRLVSAESTGGRCRQRAETSQEVRAWQAQREDLLAELLALDAPASMARESQLKPVLRSLREQLQELSRQVPGCSPESTEPPSRHDWGYRAVALEDEILLLYRHPEGRVSFERRTRILRHQVRTLTDRIAAGLERRDLDDETWRQLVQPLAEALLPVDSSSLFPTTPFALHGVLQGVPLAALPLPRGESVRWLGDRTSVVLRPAGGRPSGSSRHLKDAPLFVVDPRSDLPSGTELVSVYRAFFPQAKILSADEVTRDTFFQALPQASFLHVDAHGQYSSAFPELSSLQLADRPVTLTELSELAPSLELANLSGCQTGRWPTTADSGRYGMAGLFARSGTTWVVASRADLDDGLARDFNREFYDALRQDLAVPEAYGRALAAVRRHHPAVAWAVLLLLSPGEAGQGGKG